jgi:uncharacterized membrane protein (DUF2068 family)
MTGLTIIGWWRLLKGILFAAAGAGTVSLLHRDVGQAATDLLHWTHIDPHSSYGAWVLSKVSLLDPKHIEEIGAGLFLYAAVLVTEGVGLLMKKRWAEHLTVAATSLFVPVEVYELFQKLTVARAAVLAANLAIVWYLARHLRSTAGSAQSRP